jgi:hypothetical protein
VVEYTLSPSDARRREEAKINRLGKGEGRRGAGGREKEEMREEAENNRLGMGGREGEGARRREGEGTEGRKEEESRVGDVERK